MSHVPIEQARISLATTTLVFGAAASGKSAYAEQLAAASGRQVVYIATAAADDNEMEERIMRHRQRRPHQWQTVEQTLALGDAIATWSRPESIVLVDCLTVWLSNLLFTEGAHYPDVGPIHAPPHFTEQRALLLQSLEQACGEVILVSNEVGMGVIPQGAISRWFVDEAGRLNQDIAARCDNVYWVAAGLPLTLKRTPC